MTQLLFLHPFFFSEPRCEYFRPDGREVRINCGGFLSGWKYRGKGLERALTRIMKGGDWQKLAGEQGLKREIERSSEASLTGL